MLRAFSREIFKEKIITQGFFTAKVYFEIEGDGAIFICQILDKNNNIVYHSNQPMFLNERETALIATFQGDVNNEYCVKIIHTNKVDEDRLLCKIPFYTCWCIKYENSKGFLQFEKTDEVYPILDYDAFIKNNFKK